MNRWKSWTQAIKHYDIVFKKGCDCDRFPGTGRPIPDVDYLCLLCIDFYVWDAVSTFNHLPRMFLSTDFAF